MGTEKEISPMISWSRESANNQVHDTAFKGERSEWGGAVIPLLWQAGL